MKHLVTLSLVALLLTASLSCVSAAVPPSSPPVSVTPAADIVFTSTRQVTSLTALPDGTLWVGTSGGVLRRSNEGVWRKWTRLDGLPAHEVRSIDVGADGAVTVTVPRKTVAWRDETWIAQPEPAATAAAQAVSDEEPRGEGETCRAVWRGAPVIATLSGLHVGHKNGQQVPLPPASRGTHISALLPRGETLWVALFGDGLWTWDGKVWKAANVGLPPEAREITALAAYGGTLWVGTRRAGVWQREGGKEGLWAQHLQPDEPFDHNVQALAMQDGALLVSTLEDGLAVRDERGWRRETPSVLSSDAPRQMVGFGGALYLRHRNGKVDRLEGDGKTWTRNVLPNLPRKQVSALAADEKRLYVAQWGGWSEWDGANWTHRLTLSELQGLPITAFLPDGDTLWVGTQGRGLAQIQRATGRFVRWHDERHGLPDDWITALTRVGDTVCVGTFVGGLARWNGSKWTSPSELAGQNVTALEPDGAGGMFIATRAGVWHRSVTGAMKPLGKRFPFLDTEAQALLRSLEDNNGLWVATRTGLFFVRVTLSEQTVLVASEKDAPR